MIARVNLIGQQFGRLVVTGRAENAKRGFAQWHCRCSCGNHVVVRGAQLRGGRSKSCGCLRKEVVAEIGRSQARHGHAKGNRRSPTLQSYDGAKRRCQNPNDKNYADYGARGVKFLYASFEEFFADLGERPPGLTLERTDNHGHYERGNARWATRTEQNNNTRRNVLITAFGRRRTIARWSREVGVRHHTIQARLRRGWSPEEALTPARRSLIPKFRSDGRIVRATNPRRA
jgi:hypothetical protein